MRLALGQLVLKIGLGFKTFSSMLKKIAKRYVLADLSTPAAKLTDDTIVSALSVSTRWKIPGFCLTDIVSLPFTARAAVSHNLIQQTSASIV
jgi:hypothetical protein